MNRDEFYMGEAVKAARQNIGKMEYPFGSCIVTSDYVMVTATNSCIAHRDPTRHAEMNAIRNLCKLLGRAIHEDAVIYATTEPCIMCMGAINWARIPRVVYGLSLKDSIKYGFDEVRITAQQLVESFPYRLDIIGGFMEDECKSLFDEWAKKKKLLDLFKKKGC